ncbi:cell cycle control protein [Scheffersomyces amazonensis]|uniref:cell cycle control protein n=1 Tax=Scheffersomyces amazonensis TaxID=1078765 RepID=UPI00315C97C3
MGDIENSQVTSEKILKDAFDIREKPLERPAQSIQDLDELRSFQLKKRKEYEQQLNKNRLNFGQWIRYAKWELNHNRDFPRARSIFERALDVNVQHIPFWIQYIQLELSHKNINHARNLLDRATTTLPRVNKFWFLYVQTEETLKNYKMVRILFERWLEWHPDSSAWDAYIGFERRYDEFDNARNIFSRYVIEHPGSDTWLKWIEFEIHEVSSITENIINVRRVFEISADSILTNKSSKSNDEKFPLIISQWAEWEISVKEYERARAIYNIILDTSKVKLSTFQRNEILKNFSDFEKNHGNKDSIQSTIIQKRLIKYEQDLIETPDDYDTWWIYINLLSENAKPETLRSKFKKSVSKVPSEKVKSITWKRYIYLWIRYILWEEFNCGDIEESRSLWNQCIKIIPHSHFTFGKVWKHYAEFELRNDEQNGLSKARKILGRSIGQSSSQKSKKSLFKYYINFEKKLGEWDRVRKLYERWLEIDTLSKANTNSIPIVLDYIEFEKSLNEYDRVLSIFNASLVLADHEDLSKKFIPLETLWISFIHYFQDEMKYDEARKLYRTLIDKTDNSRVWISLAVFESSIPTYEQLQEFNESNEEELEFSITETHRQNTRSIFKEADKFYKDKQLNEQRLVILEAWKEYELEHGNEESIKQIEARMPTLVKRRRKVDNFEEEYIEYIFPQDQAGISAKPGISKFLENAKKWKSMAQ